MHVQVFSASHSKSSVASAAKALRLGGLVVFPTDTVYGLACDATNQQAVDKLKAFKGQRGNKAISIAVRDQTMAEQYAELNATAKNLYSQFLPGPLTIISKTKTSTNSHSKAYLTRSLNSSERARHPEHALRDVTSKAAEGLPSINTKTILAQGISSLEGTVGIRIIPHPFVLELFKRIDFPITATSANISGGANPRSLEQWIESTPKNKQEMIDVFIDAGELPYSEPSTVIDTSKEDTEIVRQGTLELAHLVARRTSHVRSFTSHSPEETKDIAKQLASDLRTSNSKLRTKAIIIALQGPLGAGKTVFTQGLAHALGISEPLRSPTYTLVKEYKLSKQKLDNADTLSKSALSSRADLATARSQTIEGPRTPNSELRTLYHIDAWRLSSLDEFQDLGLNKILKPRNIIVIEWPQRLNQLLNTLHNPIHLISVEVKSVNRRKITITHFNDDYLLI